MYWVCVCSPSRTSSQSGTQRLLAVSWTAYPPRCLWQVTASCSDELIETTFTHCSTHITLIEIALFQALLTAVVSADVRVCRLSALSLAVEQTRVCRKLLSAQGRGRYLLRLALSRKALPQFITHLLHTPRVLEVRHVDQIRFYSAKYLEIDAFFWCCSYLYFSGHCWVLWAKCPPNMPIARVTF